MIIRKSAVTLASFILAVIPVSALHAQDGSFTVAVIPDTQFYTDFTHQTEEGFPFDARELLYDQMDYIARNAQSQGGDIAFATAVGDVWEHPTERMDAEHRARGFKAIANKFLEDVDIVPDPRTRTVEMPIARHAYQIVAGKLPFSVVPGNHDYDANWSDARYAPAEDPGNPGNNRFPYGMLAYGGLKNWTSVFGADTPFFKGKDWYVASYHDGADSAQLFTAGGYRFLHIGLEMAPADDVLRWAEGVIKAHPGLPTIISTHDHLNPKGDREPMAAVDFKAVDPAHNNPEDVWTKLVSREDQVFMVLSGHQYGQSRRVDTNRFGHKVYQIMADYQERHQAFIAIAPDRAKSRVGLGDGWLRLMRFDLMAATPTVRVRTYSTHYKSTADRLPTYSAFYKAAEKPQLSDAAFIAEEEFTLPLDDFKERFQAARIGTR
ncbi:serine/threonine protein phosphatase [Sphingobium aquiterrae]|uniref:serine/threonine protein phosphatase n=1 Tax=Sphingobium aquiterrae TaxID=2038656 RepID=UPI00301ADB13